jgi:uncharacterized membrane protein
MVLGDSGIHAKVGQEFWEAVAASSPGIFEKAILPEDLSTPWIIGEKLGLHFPYDAATDVNGLPMTWISVMKRRHADCSRFK